MKNVISLFHFLIFFIYYCNSQNEGTIIIKKPVAEIKSTDTNLITGKWVRLNNYKKENIWPGQSMEKEFIDTIYFTSDHIYTERQNNKGANALWSIGRMGNYFKYRDCIRYDNFEYFFMKDGKTYKNPIKGNRETLYEEFGVIAKDTIGILHSSMDDGGPIIHGEIYYYVRVK